MGAHVRPLSSPQTRSEFEGKKREADRPNPDIVFKFNENAINNGLLAKCGYDSCEDHGLMSVYKNVSGAFPQSPLVDSGGEAERLNRGCFCITLDRNALTEALNREVGSQDFAQRLAASHPSLFSNVPAFIPSDTLIEMTRVVDAVETAARLPDYREAVLSWAPPIARLDLGPVGALMSYDFHVTASGPKLIEVNTNAGGAFLNAALARAQRTCCAEAHVPFEISPSQDFGSKIVDMFVAEWQRQRGSGRPTMIAIVDDAPEEQYLFPEFRLAKALLEEYGFETVIADAKKLLLDGKALLIGSLPIDLVYNRLVDFALEEPPHAALRAAYVGGNVVVTPNPRAHALFADKRNLTVLSNTDSLKHWGLAQNHLDVLRASVPTTVVVSPDNADALWRDRRNLFFKPARGHGSKATYRGDKITRKVWAEIIGGEYVAQSYAAPGMRGVQLDETRAELKITCACTPSLGLSCWPLLAFTKGRLRTCARPAAGSLQSWRFASRWRFRSGA
jgi:hypothetical protein